MSTSSLMDNPTPGRGLDGDREEALMCRLPSLFMVRKQKKRKKKRKETGEGEWNDQLF
jgi:hypothetical protein